MSFRALLKGLRRAPTYSLRWSLVAFSLISVGIAVWNAIIRSTTGVVVALGASVVLIALGLASQHFAVRSGAVERDRKREAELRAEIAGWSDWKKVAYMAVALAAGAVVILLRIWSPG